MGIYLNLGKEAFIEAINSEIFVTEYEVRVLCEKYEMKYDDISNWYDGYVISGKIPIDKRKASRQGKYTEHEISVYSPY